MHIGNLTDLNKVAIVHKMMGIKLYFLQLSKLLSSSDRRGIVPLRDLYGLVTKQEMLCHSIHVE